MNNQYVYSQKILNYKHQISNRYGMPGCNTKSLERRESKFPFLKHAFDLGVNYVDTAATYLKGNGFGEKLYPEKNAAEVKHVVR